MKINLVLGQQLVFPPIRGGGVENLIWSLASEFVALGHEVVVYSRAVKELTNRETDARGIHHRRHVGNPLHPNIWVDHLNAFRWALTLIPCLEQADVTSFHTAFSFLLRYRSHLGVCTHTIHRTPKRTVALYRNLDRIYCGSEAVLKQALAVDPGLPNLKRVYNCIGISPDSKPPSPEPRARQGLQFLYLGRFVRDKGLESLVKGFERTRTAFPSNRLVTIGPQRDEGGADSGFFLEMSAYVRGQNMADCVEFLPPIFDKVELVEKIRKADVLCMPSLGGETFSIAALEGMAEGKPILVSDFGPMPEVIDHKVSGYICRAGDAESLAEGIGFFSNNTHLISLLGAAAFLKARECFSAEVIAKEYISDFENLISQRRTLDDGNT